MDFKKVLEKRMDDYRNMDYPEFMYLEDDYYGKYVLRPVCIISFDNYVDGMSREYFREISARSFKCWEDCRKVYQWPATFVLKEEKAFGTEITRELVWVVYVPDINDNKDWVKNNINKASIFTQYPKYAGAKSLPFATHVDKYFKKFLDKYPECRLK